MPLYRKLTEEIAVVILVPPEAPITITTSPSLSAITVGLTDDKERLPGAMKFEGEGWSPK